MYLFFIKNYVGNFEIVDMKPSIAFKARQKLNSHALAKIFDWEHKIAHEQINVYSIS